MTSIRESAIFLSLTFLILVLCYPCEAALEDMYGFPGEYITSFGASVRGIGLGGAYTGVCDEYSQACFNPASISSVTNRQASFFYASLFEAAKYQFLSFTHPLAGKGVLSFSWFDLSCQDIEEVVLEGGVWARNSNFSNRHSLYMFSYACKIKGRFNAGASLKMYNNSLKDLSASAYAADLGITFMPFDIASLGICAQNVLSKAMIMDEVKESLPRTIRSGIAVKPLKDRLLLVFDIQKYIISGVSSPAGENSLPWVWYAGMEFVPAKKFSLRTGYNGKEIDFGLGLGSKYFDFDYAIAMNSISPMHCFSLTCRFGMPPSVEEEQIERKRWELKVEESYLQAMRWYNSGEPEQAKLELHRLLMLDPDSKRGQELLESVYRLEVGKLTGTQRVSKANDAFTFALKEYRAGRYDNARMRIEEVLVLNPKHGEAYVLRFLVRVRQLLAENDLSEARKRLMEALKINPDYSEAIELFNMIKKQGESR